MTWNFDLQQQVSDEWAAYALLSVAIISAVWAIATFRNIASHRSWGWLSFPMWLAIMIVVDFCGMYALLGWAVFRSPGGVPLWSWIYMVACAVIAIIAFVAWGGERRNGKK
jgi:hypothetical protein